MDWISADHHLPRFLVELLVGELGVGGGEGGGEAVVLAQEEVCIDVSSMFSLARTSPARKS